MGLKVKDDFLKENISRILSSDKKALTLFRVDSIHSSLVLDESLLRWGQGVENTSVLQAEVESTPCTGDK